MTLWRPPCIALRVAVLLVWMLLWHVDQPATAEPSRSVVRVAFERRSPPLVVFQTREEDAALFDRLLNVFYDARAERLRHNYHRANELYDVVARRCGNTTSRQRQLRMWTQYQHASMLMRAIAPLAPHPVDRALIQRQALGKFREAVALSGTLRLSEMTLPFGAAERLDAFNSMGLLARELNEPDEAIECFHQAIAVNGSAFQPFNNLAIVYLSLGHVERALDASTRALERKPNEAILLHNMGTIFYGRGDEERAQWWWEKTLAVDPLATEAMACLASLHGAEGDAVRARELLTRAVEVAQPGPSRRSYRLQLALSYLHMLYESRQELEATRLHFEKALRQLQREPECSLPDPFDTIGSGSMGYYAIYQGYNDKAIRQQLARVYYKGTRERLDFVASHVTIKRSLRFRRDDATHDASAVRLRRRIRVGFLSGYLYYHSVGLLLSGVIRFLPRDEFEVFVITFDSARRDHITKQLEETTEPNHWIVLPRRDLMRAQRRIAALELDILVFGEIGMHAETYFLAFSRLALRTVLFWGHAVTSGIATVDYFVSSTLFRRVQHVPSDQERYSECLYEMDGLTTLFPHPEAPQTGLTRASLGLPDETIVPHMVLVPQTLYKLHPDFDRIIQGVLLRVATSFLVLPIGVTPLLVEQLTRRWRRGGILDERVYKRIFFVRKLNRPEFLALCEMATVVLDPFPVGGGRSSFEVFSVGTPILGLTSRTTILQLTLGMYRRMGIEASCCMFEREDKLVEAAVELLLDRRKRHVLRTLIQRNSHKLYEASNALVVREWARFFTRILAQDPPSAMTYHDADATDKQCPHWTSRNDDVLPSQLIYESVVHSKSPMVPSHSHLVRLHDHEDPFEIADTFSDDVLQKAFLGKLLWNAQQRFRQPVVDWFVVRSVASRVAYTVEIRKGDDLHQVVRWQIQQQLLNQQAPLRDGLDSLVDQVLEIATHRVPQHTTGGWREARALVPSRHFVSLTLRSRRDCVALVVTTCKRLALFLRTMRSLADALGIQSHAHWFDHFCAVIVIDDNSSDTDRRAMRAAFPRFSFVWKTPRQRGHAVSLNLALRALAWVRFVLYVEDDWAFRPMATPGTFVRDAVAILRSTPLVQVLLNDQHSGYASQLEGRNVSYAVHEFAVLDPTQRFSYWPGFSLNPGVWDLAKLALVLDDDAPFFHEGSDLFERAFALRVWRAGVHVGYLQGATVCDHIGVKPHASAYVLNGLSRRFD